MNYRRRYYLLSDWPKWARSLTIIIIAILVALALLFFLPDASGESVQQRLPPISKYEQEFIELDRSAIREAYHDQIVHLFSTWAKDETGQPNRAIVGVRRARKMFESSMDGIDERERHFQTQPK